MVLLHLNKITFQFSPSTTELGRYPLTSVNMPKKSPELHRILRAVSLTFHGLSKITSRKYRVLEITFMVIISSRNFARVPKAWLWAHVQSFGLKFISRTICWSNYGMFVPARQNIAKVELFATAIVMDLQARISMIVSDHLTPDWQQGI